MSKKDYYKVYNTYLENPTELLIDGFASHQPVLVELLKSISEPKVIELGIGFGSTPIIVDLAKYSEHYETDIEWHNNLKKEFETKNNIFNLVTNHSKFSWDEESIFSKEWDVAFIDNASGESRQSNLMKLKDKVKFIICHDTEELYKPSASDYKWDFSSFKYHYVFTKYNTYTSVVSNYENFTL
jgi:hypothetical protein